MLYRGFKFWGLGKKLPLRVHIVTNHTSFNENVAFLALWVVLMEVVVNRFQQLTGLAAGGRTHIKNDIIHFWVQCNRGQHAHQLLSGQNTAVSGLLDPFMESLQTLGLFQGSTTDVELVNQAIGVPVRFSETNFPGFTLSVFFHAFFIIEEIFFHEFVIIELRNETFPVGVGRVDSERDRQLLFQCIQKELEFSLV